MLTLNTVDTFNVDWMSSQALAGICSGVTIRISDQLMCVCDSKPTFLDAHEETFSTLSIHSSDTYINF